MSVRDDVALLKQIPLFAKVDDAQLNVLAFSVERIKLANGEVLFRDGETGSGAFIVAKGEVELVRNVGAGDVTINAGEGMLIGEQTMFADVPYRGTAHTENGAEVLKISRQLFYRVAEEFPDLAVEAIKSVNEKLNSTLTDLSRVRRDL